MGDVAGFYDAIGDHYHLQVASWRELVVRSGAALGRLLGDAPLDVLDCSCGIGTQAIGLALQGHRVHGTDLSPASLARAEREARSFGVPLTTCVADMRRLEELDRDFDVVLSGGNAFAHFNPAGLVEVTRSMLSVLRPEGLLAATVRDYDALAAGRPRFHGEQVHDTAEGQRIHFQLWDWSDDGSSYRLSYFLLREEGGSFETSCERTTLYALDRAAIEAALELAGCCEIRWREPAATGYVEPVVIAHPPAR